MDLFNHLPSLYSENEDMKKLQNIVSRDLETLINNLNLTINQNFIDTATIKLTEIERVFDLKTDVTKNDEFRRERIKAKLRGQGTTTKELIKQVSSSFSNGEVEVIEMFSENKFTVKFVGVKGIPSNITDLTISIEEIKPAHLTFNFEFTYNTWKDVSRLTWGEASTSTWKELAERRIN